MLIELHKFKEKVNSFMFVLVRMTGIFFPRSRGRNLEEKEGLDSFWKPELRGTKMK